MNKTASKQDLKLVTKSSVLWNIIGSGVSASSSFILLMCVTRTVGPNYAGVFSVAFASAQLFLTLGKYGVRSYQATDVSRQISFSTYLLSRLFTCNCMLLGCLAITLIFGYSLEKTLIMLAVCLIKLVDAVEDVYHGQLQLNNKLDLAGKLLTIRNIFTMVLFAFLLWQTKKLVYSCWITGTVSLIVCCFLNNKVIKRFEKFQVQWNKREQMIIMKACFPLFLGSFLSLLIYNAPKYAIDLYCSAEMQTYYAIIFMPAFIINLFSEFVFKPLLTTLAIWWEKGQDRDFIKLLMKLLSNIFLITGLILVCSYFWGTQLLSVFYGVNVYAYRLELMLLMLGGGFSAAVYFLYNVLCAMRKQNVIFRNYLIGTVIIYVSAFALIEKGGIRVAAILYVMTEGILCFLMLLSTIKSVCKRSC